LILQRPTVPVGIGEEREPGAGASLGAELLDVGDVDAVTRQLGLSGIDVLNDELQALGRAGIAERDAASDHNRRR
jgi:hypothetical protein